MLLPPFALVPAVPVLSSPRQHTRLVMLPSVSLPQQAVGDSPRADPTAHGKGGHTRVAFCRDGFAFIAFLSQFADFIVFEDFTSKPLQTLFNKHLFNDFLVMSHSDYQV